MLGMKRIREFKEELKIPKRVEHDFVIDDESEYKVAKFEAEHVKDVHNDIIFQNRLKMQPQE